MVAGSVDSLMSAVLQLATEIEGRAGSEELVEVGTRLRESVLRPLQWTKGRKTRATAAPRTRKSTPSPNAGADHKPGGPSPVIGKRLFEVARSATALHASSASSPEVQEAVAALQDLAVQLADPSEVAGLLGELRELQAAMEARIRVARNGPYLLTNVPCLTNWLGERVDLRPEMALCRCGESSMKPICDGTHARIGFIDAKDPKRVPDQIQTRVGQQVTVIDNRGTCQHSGFCTDRLATVFHRGEEPFVTPSGGRMDEVMRAVRDCPSGALSYAIDGREAREQVDHNQCREPNIEISKDGPYRVVGGVRLIDEFGEPIGRNKGSSTEHYALCRCGHSQNKPFCSGMHWYVDFHDPVAMDDHEPTLFEWAGGLPALTRMTRLFYEKYVPQDPLLAPLFASMSADHPERVAAWLGEVFCGPRRYSETYGGYSRMISQHIGKGLTEEKRARWVELMLRSSLEAGLPNDAEFRSTFSSYIEWGSRLAVENSTDGAHPPEAMPMPHWDWNTAAGPPGSRASALSAAPDETEMPLTLPKDDEPVTFATHIRPLFRSRDRQSMRFAFDLWSYEDVTQHAIEILERLESGSMPCDGAWPKAHVDVVRRWIEGDQAP